MLAIIQEKQATGDSIGVCDFTLTHRDIYYNCERYNVPYSIIHQKPGQLVILSESAIHTVYNEEANIAER